MKKYNLIIERSEQNFLSAFNEWPWVQIILNYAVPLPLLKSKRFFSLMIPKFSDDSFLSVTVLMFKVLLFPKDILSKYEEQGTPRRPKRGIWKLTS